MNVLENSVPIKSISLKQNRISDIGVEILCNRLMNKTIKMIDLSSNKLSF